MADSLSTPSTGRMKVKLSELRQRTDSQDNPGTQALQQSAQDTLLKETLLKLKDHVAELYQSRQVNPEREVVLPASLETDMKFIWKATKYTPDERIREHIARVIYESGFLDFCDQFWNLCHWKTMWLFDLQNFAVFKVLKQCLYVVWNTSDISSDFCQALCDSGFVNTFQLTLASHFRSERPFLNNDRVVSYAKCLLGILHNIVRQKEDSHPLMRQNLKLFMLFSLSDHLMVKTKATMILSYLVKEAETNMITLNLETINFMALLLRNALEAPYHFSTKYGISAGEVLRGLNNLAANDANKSRIIESGCLPLYVAMLQPDCTDQELLLAAKGVWSISFCVKKRGDFLQSGCLEVLKQLERCENEALCHAARGALWELQSEVVIGTEISESQIDGTVIQVNVPHVMISYQWDSKPIMLKLKDRLKEEGYKVWMDVEHMSGSTLEAMALAVERAAIIIVGMSQKYKDSPSCRTEAEYTFKLRKAILPLQVEPSYIADGWLGMLVGTRLYIPVHQAVQVDSALAKVISELGNRGKISAPKNNDKPGIIKPNQAALHSSFRQNSVECNTTILKAEIQTSGLKTPSEKVEVVDWRSWCEDQVKKWLSSTGIQNITGFPSLDGSLLLELQKMFEKAPSFYYFTLQNELKLTLKESLQLSKALSHLS